MKRHFPIVTTIILTLCVVGAGVGSYRSQFKSMEVRPPEVVPERITTVEYVEIVPELEPVGEIIDVRTKEMFVPSDVPLLRDKEFINLTFEEQDLLERIAMAEARGEDTIGKALVMRVVLNRSLKTGQSIHDVIYAQNQFYTAGMMAGDDDCHEALAMVMDGWDESDGAIYFCSRGYSRYGEPLFQHGNHYFSK